MGLTLNKPLPEQDLQFISKHVNMDKLRSMYGMVTGATGWFGAWICAALDYMGCEYGKLDTRKLYPFKCDYLIHLAPGDSSELITLLAKTKVQHVLFVSSGSVYDEPPSVNCIEKRANENLFLASDLPVNIARCFSFIGAGVCQKDLAPGKFIKMALKHSVLSIENMSSIRTYMYMGNLVQWLLTLLLSDKGNIYDVGGEEQIDMISLAKGVMQGVGGQQYYSAGDWKTDPRPNYIPNLTPAKELGLKITVGLDEAINKTIEWERKNATNN